MVYANGTYPHDVRMNLVIVISIQWWSLCV